MPCKNFDFFFVKVSKREQTQVKTLYTLLIHIDVDYKKKIFYVGAYMVILQVLICYVNTRLLRNTKRICQKV